MGIKGSRGCIGQQIGLNDQRRPRFAEVAWKGNSDDIAALQDLCPLWIVVNLKKGGFRKTFDRGVQRICFGKLLGL